MRISILDDHNWENILVKSGQHPISWASPDCGCHMPHHHRAGDLGGHTLQAGGTHPLTTRDVKASERSATTVQLRAPKWDHRGRPVNGYVTDAWHSLSFHAAWSWAGGSKKCTFSRLMMQHTQHILWNQFLSRIHQSLAVWPQVNLSVNSLVCKKSTTRFLWGLHGTACASGWVTTLIGRALMYWTLKPQLWKKNRTFCQEQPELLLIRWDQTKCLHLGKVTAGT